MVLHLLFFICIHKTTQPAIQLTERIDTMAALWLLLTCLIPVALIQAWAPVAQPDPTKLPKALEFAERAWKFPQAEELQYPQTLQRPVQDTRTHPWSKGVKIDERDQSLSCMEDGDQYYFDGHMSQLLRWRTRQAFLASQPKRSLQFTVETKGLADEEEDCADFYYDETGDALCWATVGASKAFVDETSPEMAVVEEQKEEECEHSYFDRIGGDVMCWLTFLDVAQTVAATDKFKHPGHVEFDENCEEPYYDDTGDLLCWAI